MMMTMKYITLKICLVRILTSVDMINIGSDLSWSDVAGAAVDIEVVVVVVAAADIEIVVVVAFDCSPS